MLAAANRKGSKCPSPQHEQTSQICVHAREKNLGPQSDVGPSHRPRPSRPKPSHARSLPPDRRLRGPFCPLRISTKTARPSAAAPPERAVALWGPLVLGPLVTRPSPLMLYEAGVIGRKAPGVQAKPPSAARASPALARTVSGAAAGPTSLSPRWAPY